MNKPLVIKSDEQLKALAALLVYAAYKHGLVKDHIEYSDVIVPSKRCEGCEFVTIMIEPEMSVEEFTRHCYAQSIDRFQDLLDSHGEQAYLMTKYHLTDIDDMVHPLPDDIQF